MSEVDDALADQLVGLHLNPEAVALQARAHGLTPMQTMRLLLRRCGTEFTKAKQATTQAYYGLSREAYEAPFLADVAAALAEMMEAGQLHCDRRDTLFLTSH